MQLTLEIYRGIALIYHRHGLAPKGHIYEARQYLLHILEANGHRTADDACGWAFDPYKANGEGDDK